MNHFHIPQEQILKMDLPGAAGLLKPVVWIDGKYYCVLLGVDPDSGVYGRGRTLQLALDAWDKSLQKHLMKGDVNDYIVDHVRTLLGKPDIQAFYDQFRPGKKG